MSGIGVSNRRAATQARKAALRPVSRHCANSASVMPGMPRARRCSSTGSMSDKSQLSQLTHAFTPSSSHVGRGCEFTDEIMPVCMLDVGHASITTSFLMTSSTTEGSSRRLVPWPIRSACSNSIACRISVGGRPPSPAWTVRPMPNSWARPKGSA